MKLFKLGDVCDVRRGTTITQKNAVDGSVPVVAGGLKPTYFHNVANRHGKTITISGSGANAGYVNCWEVPIFASDCSTVEVRNSDLLINYVYYFLLSKQDYIYKELRSGAAQPHVYGKDIANIEIPLPPLATQQKIVTKLDAIFSEIDRATAATEANIKNAEALFQSYLTEVFGQFNKSSYVTFDSVCDFVRGPFGGSLKKSYFVDSGYAVYEQQHAINNQFVDVRYFIDENKFNEMKRFELKSGDLIMSCSGTIGKVAIAPVYLQKGVINQALLKLTPKKDVDAEFLKRLLTSAYFQNKLAEMAGGAAIQNVASVSLLKQIVIPMPSFDRQNEISKAIGDFELNLNQLISDYKKKNDSLSKLKQSILKQAFNGELVKE